MSYPKDSKANCAIYNSLLFSDLIDHTVLESGTSLSIKYTDNNTPSSCSINTTAIKSIIDAHSPTGTVRTDTWLPAIVSNNNYINNKEILFGNVIGNKLLGIEEIIKFNSIKLKNWDIVSGDMDLCVDWIINSNISSYDVEYGVLCWYKLNSIHKSDSKYKLNQIPPGTRIKATNNIEYSINNVTQTITSDTPLLKINNEFIKRLDKDSSRFDSAISGFIHNHTNELDTIPISLINIEDSTVFTVEDNTNKLSDDLKNYDLWISNGEFYSYFLGGKDKYRRFNHTIKQRRPSRSYLSPSLYHIYRTIYNQVTHKFIRDFGSTNNKTYMLEKLKKLCYILATSPLIDRVNINTILNNSIRDKIITYINSSVDTTINSEITALLNIIAEIFTEYKNQSQFLQKQTLATNYINNKKDLFTNLVNKYLAYGKMSTNTNIKFKSSIGNGPQAFIDCGIKSFIPKNNLTETVVIYNDIKIQLDSLYVDTVMNPSSQSGCICNVGDTSPTAIEKNIPLSNMLVKNPEKLLTSFNKDYALPLRLFKENDSEPLLSIANPNDRENINSLNRSYTYSWSLVDGPDCLKFSDSNKGKRDPLRGNKTSSSATTDLYLGQTGLFTIRGITTLGSSLKCIEDIDVYVYDSNNNYAPNTPFNVSEMINYSHTETVGSYTVMCPNIRKIAFNKNGLVWFIDSDMYITNLSLDIDPTPSRMVNQKINIDKISMGPSPDSSGFLSLNFKPNNTIFKLYSMQIEHMRSSHDKYAQCKSFYEPKKVRTRFAAGGSQRYALTDKFPDSLALQMYEKDTNTNEWKPASVADFGYPWVSTYNTPSVHTYGGYSQGVVEQLGIEIPFHPINVGSEIKSFPKIPIGTIWNTTGTILESGLIASNPAALNLMPYHNDMGDSNNIRCHTTYVPITGHTTFYKGYFHPNSGWYSYDATSYNPNGYRSYSMLSSNNDPNISSVKKFDNTQYKSFELAGQGFFDLRSNNAGGTNQIMEYGNSISVGGISFTPEDQDYNIGLRNWNGPLSTLVLVDDLILEDDIFMQDPNAFLCDYKPNRKYSIVRKNFTNIDLTIQDLEIKINYINLPNLKNIIFALEVSNPNLDNILTNNASSDNIFLPLNDTDRSSNPSSWTSSLSSQNNSTTTPAILSFLQSIKDTNTVSTPNTRIVYLYNQESLDNYGYNFNLVFSDNFSKYKTFTDSNKNSSNIIGPYNKPIINKEIIMPCISPTGYNEIDSSKFRQMIHNNNINLLHGSLSQFKNLPLDGTTFTLKIYVLGPEEKILQIDNTVLNSYLSGLTKYNYTESSNTIANSICSWSVVVHTAKTPKFTNTDYLGSINYENTTNISTTGYNFIANMSGIEYLIPKANLNAPYNYISINSCDYVGDPDLSKPLSYSQPQLTIPNLSLGSFSNFAGGFASIALLQQQLSQGGYNDPIISFFNDIRNNIQSELLEDATFTPIYDGFYSGVGNKALIQISDNGLLWYTLEVPIYKYKNTAILSPNRYQYLKLHKNMAVPFSNFPFTKIKNITDLVDQTAIVYSATQNINLNGLIINLNNNENITLQENDIVSVQQQTNTSDNGMYYAQSGTWLRFPALGNENSLLHNNLWGNTNLVQDIASNKVIAIPGIRAFNIFDKDDNIVIMKYPAASGSDMSANTIVDKGLIKYQNEDITLFTFNNPLSDGYDSGFIGQTLSDSNIIMIYKDTTTSNDDIAVSKWSFVNSHDDKNHINPYVLSQHSVAVGEGSIGYGSTDIVPKIYNNIDKNHPNKLLDIVDILNNNVNNKLKYNTLTINEYSTNTIKTITFPTGNNVLSKDLLKGYPSTRYSFISTRNALNEYSLLFSSGYSLNGTLINMTSGVILNDNQTKALDSILRNNLYNNQSDVYFIDLKSDKFKNDVSSISGEIFIENDWIKRMPHKPLSSDDINKINIRLSGLQSKSDPAPVSLNLTTVSSIRDLEIFYSTLPPDPSGCFQKNYYDLTTRLSNCSGHIARDRLQSLYREKNELLRALDINKYSSASILPYFETEILTSGTELYVRYKSVSDSYYMINIDPEQTCTLATDSSVKILQEIQFDCRAILPGVDSICANVPVPVDGLDESIVSGRYTYVNNRINEEKAKYPNIIWRDLTYDIERQFQIVGGHSFKETLVIVKEKYIVPEDIDYSNNQKKVKDMINLNNTSSLKIRFRNIPRKVKTIDTHFERYVPDVAGRLGKDLGNFRGDRFSKINNEFMAWQCIKIPTLNNANDQYPNNQVGQFVDPPDVYKYMNEMLFRAFFGSVDGVENKNMTNIIGKNLWEWIPYEYF